MRQWMIGIFAAALLSSVALTITPKNKKAVALAGGLIMILAAVKPLAELKYQDVAVQIAKYQIKADELRSGIDVGNSEIMALIIQEQTAAYILDKAAELGLEIEVEVTTQKASDGWPYPAATKISGQLSESDIHRLSRIISEGLAIEPDRQEWS